MFGSLLALSPWIVAPVAQAGEVDVAPSIPFEKYMLDNGLEVLLSEDHSIPFVQVNLWYRVGSKDEVAGRSGFAHLFEHLMFQGSAHHDHEYFEPLMKIGAAVNGTTSTDRTNYFEGVPSEYLPLALWLESDRMGWLLDALTQEKLDNQKLVVRNERRQSYENTPYGEVWLWLHEGMYAEGHPYHHTPIGDHADIDAATLDDVKGFFRTWYLPNNASLAISGDFDPGVAKGLVERYFGSIPAGPKPQPAVSAEAALPQGRVERRYDDVPLRKVWIAWHSPAVYAAGDADLDIVSALLSDGKDSRLYRALVHEKQIAKEVDAYQASTLLSSLFVIEATAAEGHTTDEIATEVDRLLDELRASGPTADEVEIARVNYQARFYEDLRTIGTKANQLNMYNVFTGDPAYLSRDIERYTAVTQASSHDAAKKWLVPDRRLVIHVLPRADDPAAGIGSVPAAPSGAAP